MNKITKQENQTDASNNVKEKAVRFFLSILSELSKTEIEPSILTSIIEKAWANNFYNPPWSSLLLEYNLIREKNDWMIALKSKSDKIIIDTWIKYGKPTWITDEQKELLHSAISRFGALTQIINARKMKIPSKEIEHTLSPLLGDSDLPLKDRK